MAKKYYVMYCIRKKIRIVGDGPNKLVPIPNIIIFKENHDETEYEETCHLKFF